MRWDIEASKTSAEVLKMAVKAVCSFLNGDGGTLLIGVSDTGELTGLADDIGALTKPSLDGSSWPSGRAWPTGWINTSANSGSTAS
jgi:hypothetical protein